MIDITKVPPGHWFHYPEEEPTTNYLYISGANTEKSTWKIEAQGIARGNPGRNRDVAALENAKGQVTDPAIRESMDRMRKQMEGSDS